MKYAMVIAALFFVSGCFNHPCDVGDVNLALECLHKAPAEDIAQVPLVAQHLAINKNYISVTTSPKRIKELGATLQSLDLTYIEKVLVILPERFGRDGSTYDVPEFLSKHDKVAIVRIQSDLGPISKLLGVLHLENVSEESRPFAETVVANPNNLIITIDDDSAYSKGTFGQLIKQAVLSDAVVGGSGFTPEFWPEEFFSVVGMKEGILEGYSGIAYPIKHVVGSGAMELMLLAGQKSKRCFGSDDLVIAWALSQRGIPRLVVANPYITAPLSLPHGFGEDALRHGAATGQHSSGVLHTAAYEDCYWKHLFL